MQVGNIDALSSTRRYIEGTEFELEEAHDFIVNGRPLQYREDDSHEQVLGRARDRVRR